MGNNFKAHKIDQPADYIRIRQKPPSAYDKSTFRTIEFGSFGKHGIKAIIGVPLKKTKAEMRAAGRAKAANQNRRRNPDADEVRSVLQNAGKTIREAYAIARKEAAGNYYTLKELKSEATAVLERLSFYSGWVNAALADYGFGSNLGGKLSGLSTDLGDARNALRSVTGTKHPFHTTKIGRKRYGDRRPNPRKRETPHFAVGPLATRISSMTARNDHVEAKLTLAKALGSPAFIRKAEALKQRFRQRGSMGYEDSQASYKLLNSMLAHVKRRYGSTTYRKLHGAF